MISALPSQIVKQKKELSNSPVDEDYAKSSNISGALNINRYYLVLIGRALELFGAIRLYGNPCSPAYYDQQIKYLEYVYDTMSPKVPKDECAAMTKIYDGVQKAKSQLWVRDLSNNPSMIRLGKAQEVDHGIRSLYRMILAVLDKHHMLTFKDIEPGDLLSEFGE